jgi:hypothetical protein
LNFMSFGIVAAVQSATSHLTLIVFTRAAPGRSTKVVPRKIFVSPAAPAHYFIICLI